MNENENNMFGLLDCLDPVQLGFIYESLMNNASDSGLNSKSAQSYLQHAESVKEAIEANIGFDDYCQTTQTLCRKLANYDGRH